MDGGFWGARRAVPCLWQGARHWIPVRRRHSSPHRATAHRRPPQMEMPAVPVSPAPRTVEDIFKDFANRRSALDRALTVDVDDFYVFCDPEKENLCLYGHSNGSWEVALPAEEVPPELPEPALGINFSRDGMHRRNWLSLVAVHSDSWLLSVAFFFGARLNGNERSTVGRSSAQCIKRLSPKNQILAKWSVRE